MFTLLLSYCYHDELHPNAVPIVKECRKVFHNNIAILSNSVGSGDDANYSMALQTEKALGIPVIRHKIKKPGCLQEVGVGNSETLITTLG
ncbi:hypothetical protein EON65_28510 [archaeon]|nr:MAG: hypothetical protein EON65_28510 [archaeon]